MCRRARVQPTTEKGHTHALDSARAFSRRRVGCSSRLVSRLAPGLAGRLLPAARTPRALSAVLPMGSRFWGLIGVAAPAFEAAATLLCFAVTKAGISAPPSDLLSTADFS